MGTKIIHKGIKYISQIFVVKEPELEIGCPTDVKHVAHIGWDGPSGCAPSWMNEFKTAPDYAATSIGNINESTRGSSAAISPWSSGSESMERQLPASELVKDVPPSTDPSNIRKKPRRKKVRPATASSPKSVRSSNTSSPMSVRATTNSSPKSVRPSANSSPKSSASKRSSSRPPKSKAKFVEDHAKPADLEVM